MHGGESESRLKPSPSAGFGFFEVLEAYDSDYGSDNGDLKYSPNRTLKLSPDCDVIQQTTNKIQTDEFIARIVQ